MFRKFRDVPCSWFYRRPLETEDRVLFERIFTVACLHHILIQLAIYITKSE